MANKLFNIIEQLSVDDLLRLREDVIAGHVEHHINQRLSIMEPTKSGICPVCNAKAGEEHYTLVFGPKNFRQKASFDGVDCLYYFLERLKEQIANTQEAPYPVKTR